MGIASRAKHSRRYENGSQDLSGMSETIEIMKPQREAKRVNEQIVQSLSRNATNITKRRQKMPV